MIEKGLLHLYIGNGKGKSTAAAGLAFRMAGNGFHIFFAQFLKSTPSGEIDAFDRFGGLATVCRPFMRHKGFIWNQTPEQREETAADLVAGWNLFREKLSDVSIRLFVFDELLDVIDMGFLEEDHVMDTLKSRHPEAEVVLTGRNASVQMKEMADYVTEMIMIKHPFEKGTAARRGVEY
jgi:cob(I)alamin adenosyltransferase